MSSLLKKYGVPFPYEDDLPVIPDILPGPNYAVGDVLAERYEVKELLHGAAGDVYHCFDKKNKTDVALKTIIGTSKSDRLTMLSFYREIENRLQIPTHPNVLTLKRIMNVDGYYFIVSEWVVGDSQSGNSMTDWLERHSFSLPEIVNFMQQLCTGLAHCHKNLASDGKPYAFGDLKPDNILIDQNHILKLADFSGGYTPGWCAPEQRADSNVVPDVRTDIFCLGKVASAMLNKIPNSEDDFRDAVDDLLRDCVHPRMERRCQSCQEVLERLDAICGQFQCAPYVVPRSKADTVMDRYDHLTSALSFGHYVPSNSKQSLFDRAYAHAFIRKKYLSIDEYKEYVTGDEGRIYQAMANYAQGDLSAALKELQDLHASAVRSAELYYRRATFLYISGNLDMALHNLDAAILKELYLPACDFKANILLDFPQYAAAYQVETGLMLDKLKKLPSSRFTGYLLNQIVGKYYMLANMNEYASSYFRKALQYINLTDEWLTLYYYAISENRLKHFDQARTVCNHAIQMILSDTRYLQSSKQCVILLFCNKMIDNLQEIQRLVGYIQDTFGLDYRSMLPSSQ